MQNPPCSVHARIRSDFDWMRDVLVMRFHGMAIPLLPPKRAVNNSDSNFIEERRAGLQQWLLDVTASPYLKSDTTLKTFVSISSSSEFEQAKKAVLQGGGGANPAENPGLAHWFGVLRAYQLPEDYPAAIGEVQGMANEMEKTIESALSAVEAYHEAALRLDETMSDMQMAFQGIADTADRCAGSLSSSLGPARQATSQLHEQLALGARAFREIGELNHFAPNELEKFIAASLRSEQRRVGGLQALMEVRAAAEREYAAAFKAQDALQLQEKQLKDKGKDELLAKLAPRVVDACALTQRMLERVEDITKGVLCFEAARNSRARLANIKNMIGQYATLGIASGERTQQVWSVLLLDAGLDQASMLARAQAILQSKAVAEETGGLPGPVDAVDAGEHAAPAATSGSAAPPAAVSAEAPKEPSSTTEDVEL